MLRYTCLSLVVVVCSVFLDLGIGFRLLFVVVILLDALVVCRAC